MKIIDDRVVAWFSCGVPSAVASYLAIQKYGDRVEVVRADTGSEHPDNERFMGDVEDWLGVKVKIIRSGKYYNVDEVFDQLRFLRGPNGARCTLEMKKKPRFSFERIDDIHVFGYTADKRDEKRAVIFVERNPELKLEFPLLDQRYDRKHCERIIEKAGIKIPEMYRLGFKNNNCIGCVKSESPAYWMKVKKYFPAVFKKRSEQERDLGYALCRINRGPVFLDEVERLKSPQMDLFSEDSINCDFLCGGQEI